MEVKSTELAIKDVLDQYYSWLVNLMGPKGSDRVALVEPIVTHDVVREAPLYTEGIFRSFVDRTLTISPEDFGAGNTTDRYSRRYEELINIAGYEVYQAATFTPQQTNDLQKQDDEMKSALNEINATRTAANKEWATQAAQLHLTPNTPQYDLERANFYQPYLTVLRNLRNKITRARTKRLSIMMSVFNDDHDAAQLSRVYERCESQEDIQYLPLSTDVEVKYHLDPINIGEAARAGLYGFEAGLGINPSGSLIRMLDYKGSRNITLSNEHTAEFKHDQVWNVSGSASSWITVFRCDVGAQAESHFRQSLLNTESITIACDFMAEYWVRRGDWFDSTIFENKYVKEQLKKRPDRAALLALCVSSVIVVRGLKVTYKFKDVNDTAIWSSWNAHAGGGFTAWGINFGLSAGGSGSSYTNTINTVEKSVTFLDEPNVCRLLAIRASTLIKAPDQLIALAGKYLDASGIGLELIKAWKTGEVSFGVIPAVLAHETHLDFAAESDESPARKREGRNKRK